MQLVETLPVGEGTAQWELWGTVARIVVTDPAMLTDAAAIVRAEVAAVDAACSRFRPDSELNAACRAGAPVTVSPLLAELVGAALEAARQTGGAVDPTVGAALCGSATTATSPRSPDTASPRPYGSSRRLTGGRSGCTSAG